MNSTADPGCPPTTCSRSYENSATPNNPNQSPPWLPAAMAQSMPPLQLRRPLGVSLWSLQSSPPRKRTPLHEHSRLRAISADAGDKGAVALFVVAPTSSVEAGIHGFPRERKGSGAAGAGLRINQASSFPPLPASTCSTYEN